MIQIPIDPVPNQSFNIQLDGINYELFLRDQGALMSISILISNIPVILGARVIASFPLIPYQYLARGNFIFLTADDEYPFYDRFNIDQYLIYASQDELNAIRNGTFIPPVVV
jgi:hypothetical protein